MLQSCIPCSAHTPSAATSYAFMTSGPPSRYYPLSDSLTCTYPPPRTIAAAPEPPLRVAPGAILVGVVPSG